MDATQVLLLPPASDLSPAVLSFLDHKFRTKETLAEAPDLVSELQTQCSDLNRSLIDLNLRLETSLVAHSSFSDRIHGLFGNVNSKLTGLGSPNRPQNSESDGGDFEREKILGEELPALAKEVARMEMVRMYAETAMKLDNMVGDIEDAVSSTMNKNLRKHSSVQNSKDMRLAAIKSLKLTEEILTSVTKERPQWTCLISAVDHRVDRALAILRPQAIADHRTLLSSLGWPPPLSTLTLSTDADKSTQIPNPLFTMQGDLKHQYCENFLALCSLQELQRQRKSRQLEGYNKEIALQQPLWAIEELVNPISLSSQRHFSKWVDKPELIFALVYKIANDYVDSMDELLQPLVDEAMLEGYSCREEWVSAMVSSLSTYLAKEVFPIYISQLDEESDMGAKLQGILSFLHLVDLMISFDKRIKTLVERSGVLLSFEEDGNLQKISSLSVFSDRPDWLDLWAEMELSDALDKLKPEIDDERKWTTKVQVSVLSSSPENYKSPIITSAFLQCLSSSIDHCRSLANVSSRSRFLKLAGLPIIRRFLDSVLLRCQEAEGLTALTDDDALIKVANSINAVKYFESVLKEWCEDLFVIEIGLSDGRGIIDEEIGRLEDFITEWVEKLSMVIFRGFDAQSRDYIKNRRQWQERGEEGWTVSKSLVGALDYLQGKMSVLETNLNGVDFVGLWRGLASALDRLFFNGILMGNVKFYDGGVQRFSADLEVLFGVFGAWCLRAEGFFPKTSEGLKLLKMGKEQVEDYSLVGGEKWLKENKVAHLSVYEAEKIMKCRVYKSYHLRF